MTVDHLQERNELARQLSAATSRTTTPIPRARQIETHRTPSTRGTITPEPAQWI